MYGGPLLKYNPGEMLCLFDLSPCLDDTSETTRDGIPRNSLTLHLCNFFRISMRQLLLNLKRRPGIVKNVYFPRFSPTSNFQYNIDFNCTLYSR